MSNPQQPRSYRSVTCCHLVNYNFCIHVVPGVVTGLEISDVTSNSLSMRWNQVKGSSGYTLFASLTVKRRKRQVNVFSQNVSVVIVHFL